MVIETVPVPSKSGWYWIKDDELVCNDCILCRLFTEETPVRLVLFTPQEKQQVWNLVESIDKPGEWWTSPNHDDYDVTWCVPVDWILIEPPTEAAQ